VTGESNNLTSGATAAIASLPNDHSYVFTQYCASTTGKTTFTPRVFVRDYDDDNASTPSNMGGQAFWMSPDIILVTHGATGVNKDSVSSVSTVTAGGVYDIYVRAHNEIGCAAVKGVKARVMYANPSALSTDWHDIDSNSAGAYLGTTDPTGHPLLANGLNIAATEYDILGPFVWTVPTNIDSPHQCLLVDIIAAGGEDAPSSDKSVMGNMWDAPNSYQVAQRNLEVGNDCSYSLVNGTGASGQLTLTLQATSGGQAYQPTPNDVVQVTFDDPGQQWGLSWPGGGTAGYTKSYAATGGTAGTGATTIQLLQGQVTLLVTMSAGDSRNVASYVLPEFGSGTTIDMNLGASLALSSSPGGSGGLGFSVTNGLTCQATADTEIVPE
jgi:hypothetical protein